MALETTYPSFRVRFDVPYSFAVEPGFRRSTHCFNFREEKGSGNGTYRDPNTGLVMLTPSFLSATWHNDANWAAIDQWTTDTAFWQGVYRNLNYPQAGGAAVAAAHLFTMLPPSGSSSSWDGTSVTANLVAVSFSLVNLVAAYSADVLKWVLKSNFSLQPDEGFVLHYRIHGDELARPNNLLFFTVDDLAFHVSGLGVARLYQYQSSAWVLLEEFPLCSPGDFINKDGYFIVVPIPGYGLSVYNSLTAQRLDHKSSTAQAGVSRGKLLKLARTDGSGNAYVHNGGVVNIAYGAMLSKLQPHFGFHRIRYDTTTSGTFLGEIFDPGYKPANAPASSQAITIPVDSARGTSATVAVRRIDDSDAWTAGTDRQGRLKTTLSTSSSYYTPFLLGTGVGWNPVFASRNTTAVTPDSLLALEFTEDDAGTFSGSCLTLWKTDAGRKVVERGDATFVVERSDDGGTTWVTQGGGLASIAAPVQVMLDRGGIYYQASWQLDGLEKRFSEITQFSPNAFDGLDLGTAISTVLLASGFPGLAFGDYPASFASINLPQTPQGQEWRYGSKLGENGLDIIRGLLLLAKTQYVAYRIRYDWANNKWIVEQRPRDTTTGATWTLTPYEDELTSSGSPVARTALMASGSPLALTFIPQPPEANIIQPFGLTEISQQASRLPGTPIVNAPSISDNTSVDYLGRCKMAFPMFAPITDIGDINKMGRRVFEAAAHRRLLVTVPGAGYVAGLTPLKRVLLRGENAAKTRGTLFGGQDFWVRRRTYRMEYNTEGDMVIHAEYNLDSVWEEML